MIRQLSLFDQPHRTIKPCDPTVTKAAAPRLSRQCREILARLREGSATNTELAIISRKYTSRISDLRWVGCIVTCFDHDHKTGLARYRLDFTPEGL